MNEQREKPSAIKVAIIVVVFLFVGFFITIGVPDFLRAACQSGANGCINNLRQIDAAKEEWKLENGKKDGSVVTEADLTPYIKLDSNGHLPKCPAGGTYILERIGKDPQCSISTSAWPNDHVLNDTNDNWWFNFKATYRIVFGLRHVEAPPIGPRQ